MRDRLNCGNEIGVERLHILICQHGIGNVGHRRIERGAILADAMTDRPFEIGKVVSADAGVGELVLIVSGSSARMAAGMKDCPVDAAIVGVIDTVEVLD